MRFIGMGPGAACKAGVSRGSGPIAAIDERAATAGAFAQAREA